MKRTSSAVGVFVVALFHFAVCHAQIAPPQLVFHARYWDVIPGWEPRDGDAAYIEFTPSGDLEKDVDAILNGDLAKVDSKWRMLGTNSVRHLAEILSSLVEVHDFPIAYLGYDLEYRPQTPEEEQADPVTACKELRKIADRHGIPLLLVPTANVTGEWGVKIASFAEMFQPQGKAYQAYATSLAVYRQRKTYGELREANPGVVFYHDMAMVPKGKDLPLDDLLDYYYGCSDMVVANSIWALPQHLPMLQQYILTVRPPASPPPGVKSPVVVEKASVSRQHGLVGEELSFTVVGDDPDGDTLTYTWDFGDRRAWADGRVLVRGKDVSHTYLEPGEYSAHVSITDGRGGAAQSIVTVTITVDPPFARPNR